MGEERLLGGVAGPPDSLLGGEDGPPDWTGDDEADCLLGEGGWAGRLGDGGPADGGVADRVGEEVADRPEEGVEGESRDAGLHTVSELDK